MMEVKTPDFNIKHNGATFTPKLLAQYLSKEIIDNLNGNTPTLDMNILDPACGNGELLLSINEMMQQYDTKLHCQGYDINADYTMESESRLNQHGVSNSIVKGDFLQLFLDKEIPTNHFDMVIANPPYVRTQILGENKAQSLAKAFNLKGRVDLYYPFLIAMTEALKEGGLLGVITSNRYLFTKSGKSIRDFLANNFDIIKVVDLGDTKLFEKAAVLPAIFIGKKKKATNAKTNGSQFIKIYETKENDVTIEGIEDNIYDILEKKEDGIFLSNGKKYCKTSGSIFPQKSKGEVWKMLTHSELAWVNTIEKNAPFRIKDFAKVRVGVKTTADNVFIKDDWEKMPLEQRPECELLLPLISSTTIQGWQTPISSTEKVLYTHQAHNGKRFVIDLEKYPKAKDYLETHRAQLEGRNYVIKANRKWYEIWVPQNPLFWKRPKLVFPDISEYPRFYFDEKGTIANGNCYWIINDHNGDKDLLFLIQGIANSKMMTTYHDLCFGNKLYAGRRRYLSQYVENYPLPNPSSESARKIIALVKDINQKTQTGDNIDKLLDALEYAVCAAFKIRLD
jgi:methylase of polypeptide subunit release factors